MRIRGAAVLLVFTAVLFGPLARAGWVYDDFWFIVRNPALRHVDPLAFFLRPETFAAGPAGLSLNNFRPLAVLSLALDVWAWGLRPALFHVENLLWHLLNALLVLALARRWLKSDAGAWLAACVFLIHPVQVETAAWVSQRSNLLCVAGMLATLWLFLERMDYWALGAYAVALFSKEEAVVLPLLLFLCERPRRRAYVGLTALTLAYAASRTLLGHPWSQFDDGQTSLSTNLALGALSFAVYLGKLLVPIALRPSYDYPAFHPWLIAGSTLLLGGWVALAWVKRRTIPGLALAWILVALLPVLHLAPLRPFAAERLLYAALVGAGLAAGWLYERGRPWRGVVLAWLAALAVQTARTVPHWMTERSLWAAAVAAEPTNAFARVCYAQALEDPAQAEAQYKAALTSDPSDASRFAALNNLSNLMLRAGRAKEAGYWASLAAREQPGDVHALYNLCRAYEAAGDPRRAGACVALRRRQTEPSLP